MNNGISKESTSVSYVSFDRAVELAGGLKRENFV